MLIGTCAALWEQLWMHLYYFYNSLGHAFAFLVCMLIVNYTLIYK